MNTMKPDRRIQRFCEATIAKRLGDEMRHFFSDYQHIAKAFLTLSKQMDELRKIDKDKQPNLFEHAVASILTHGHR